MNVLRHTRIENHVLCIELWILHCHPLADCMTPSNMAIKQLKELFWNVAAWMPSPPTSRWRWKKVDWSSSRSRTTARVLGWVKDLSAHAWLWPPNKITRNAHEVLRRDRKDPLERLCRLHQVRYRLFELILPLHRDCVRAAHGLMRRRRTILFSDRAVHFIVTAERRHGNCLWKVHHQQTPDFWGPVGHCYLWV